MAVSFIGMVWFVCDMIDQFSSSHTCLGFALRYSLGAKRLQQQNVRERYSYHRCKKPLRSQHWQVQSSGRGCQDDRSNDAEVYGVPNLVR